MNAKLKEEALTLLETPYGKNIQDIILAGEKYPNNLMFNDLLSRVVEAAKAHVAAMSNPKSFI